MNQTGHVQCHYKGDVVLRTSPAAPPPTATTATATATTPSLYEIWKHLRTHKKKKTHHKASGRNNQGGRGKALSYSSAVPILFYKMHILIIFHLHFKQLKENNYKKTFNKTSCLTVDTEHGKEICIANIMFFKKKRRGDPCS